MAKETYQSLRTQIIRLQGKAEALRSKLRQPVIDSIVRQMSEYSISIEELETEQKDKGQTSKKATAVHKASAIVKTKRQVAPKYRHPETGETWTGRGKAPRWLAAAVRQGKTRESFLIA